MTTQKSAFIWAQLGLLKPSSSGAYSSLSWVIFVEIIIIIGLLLVKSLFDSGDKSSCDSLSHLSGFPPSQ